MEKVPHGYWLSTTFVAGLRLTGWVAPLTIDGALNGELFRRYVEQHLAPALQPGDLVVMDNLASRKVAGVREALQNVGADVLYLPPYSPDFNPIEQAFSKLNADSKSQATYDGTTLGDLRKTAGSLHRIRLFKLHHALRRPLQLGAVRSRAGDALWVWFDQSSIPDSLTVLHLEIRFQQRLGVSESCT